MKILELIIDAFDELTGVDAVALVEKPAIEADFMAFKEVDVEDVIVFNLLKLEVEEQFGTGSYESIVDEQSSEKFSFSLDEDQQIVVGPLMIPNKLIYRVDEEGDPYFVFFSEDTIQKVSDKLMKQNHMHTLNVEHNPLDTVDGYMMETWLVEDPINDKQQVYGFNYPKGSWMGKYKIEDMEVWQKVKNKEINGFSIEGFFSDRFVQAQAQTK